MCSSRSGLDTKSDGTIVSTRCSDESRFVLYEDRQLWANYDALGNVKDRVSATALTKMEQKFGLTYVSDGALACKELRDYISPSTQIFYDPAHVYLSNGVLSWSIWNLLEKLHRVISGKLGWCSLSTFLEEISWHVPIPWQRAAPPNMIRALGSAERIKASRASDHYKGGASEHLLLFRLLRHFCEKVVCRVQGMEQASEAFVSVCNCIEGLFGPQCNGRWIRSRAPPETMREHARTAFDLFFRACGDMNPEVKPKWHYTFHMRSGTINNSAT